MMRSPFARRPSDRAEVGVEFNAAVAGAMRHRVLGALIFIVSSLATPAAAQEVRYYSAPSRAGPHDVTPAPDGNVWYTAQRQGALGRLDPAGGNVQQIPLGDGSAAPHGVIVGLDGAAWVTDSGLNAIVRVNPATKAVQRFPLPEGRGSANLSTATFDASPTTGSARTAHDGLPPHSHD